MTHVHACGSGARTRRVRSGVPHVGRGDIAIVVFAEGNHAATE
jgi:hypothetical protein